MSTERHEADARRGAQTSELALSDLFRAWLENHHTVIKDSATRLWLNPLSTLLTWLVIGIALALPMTLYILLNNVQTLSFSLDNSAQISLYLKHTVSRSEGEKLALELALQTDIRSTEYISQQQALDEFRDLSGFGGAIDGLDNNPLPAVILIKPAPAVLENAASQSLLDELSVIPQVDMAQLDLEWLQRLYTMMDIVERVVNALTVLLSLGVLSIIGNTIRLMIESRRDEIVIIKLVGATNTFIRRPFLYTGLLYGFGGALMSWCIVAVALWWFSPPVLTLVDLYQSDFQLRGLDIIDTVLLLLGGSMLGWIGAWLAVNRHIGEIEPQ